MFQFLIPHLIGQFPEESQIEFWKDRMEIALDEIENVWLKENKYILGNEISAADLFALCEIDQPRKFVYFFLKVEKGLHN